ncbi:MAG TPA: GNAT family N-acetyltransferase [Chitinophagaceae bacterium]|nr:GNAT family N-acetyltransferase [Chitinophagaceae bacterium]
MTLVITPATKSKAELIADMSRDTFYETFAPYNTPENMEIFMTRQFTREKLIEEVGLPDNIFFLAWFDDMPAGYAKLRIGKNPPGLDKNDVIEIARIYAKAEFIGKGIGKALINKCIDFAREKNKEIIWLGVWEENKRAIDFYKRKGFQKFGTQIFMLGDDAQTDWLMKLDLK